MSPQAFPVRNPPETLVKSSHGLQIKVKGVAIGSISIWRPAALERGMTHIFELNPLSSGHPFDVVPGNLGGFTIDVERYDIWKEPFEKVFGGSVSLVEAIGNQKSPFEAFQYIQHPDGYKELMVYRQCWLSSVGREYSSTGDRIVMTRGRLTYVRRDKVL
jgi:hypothetical protein